MSEISLDKSVEFSCSNGGTITMIGTADDLSRFGVTSDGWAYYDDLHLNPDVDMTLDVGGRYNPTATVQHLTGDPIMVFDITSRQPNGRADMKITGLKPESWYRLEFSGVLAETASGYAHDQTSTLGHIQWTGVNVPNE